MVYLRQKFLQTFGFHFAKKLFGLFGFDYNIMSATDLFDRAYGCLLGQAIGDALGTRYEFKNSPVTKSMIAKDLLTHKTTHLPILGGGPFSMEAGQVTDDTEMAMGLARSIQRCGRFDVMDVAESYAHWYDSRPPDIGITTSNAFVHVKMGMSKEEIYENMIRASEEKNRWSLSNGCLMRISPLVIAGSGWPLETVREAAMKECRLTHPSPVAQDAVATYVTVMWTLINTGDRSKAIDEAVKRIQTPEIRQLVEATDNPTIPIKQRHGDKVEWIDGDGQHQGYLGVALKWTFMELRSNGDNFDKALVSVISRGGDTDTNGCIVGAILGAYLGASRIPADWKQAVLEAKPRRLAEYEWVKMADAEGLVKDLMAAKCPQ